MSKSRLFKFSLRIVTLLLVFLSMPPTSGYAEPANPVTAALMVRHLNATSTQLEELAGGKDALVTQLLQLRHDEKTPFVAVRAQKFLLEYADREDVRTALESDLASASYAGLARVVALNLDTVKSSGTRETLARLAIDRGTRDQSFAPYARGLKESKDESVRKLAVAAFGN